MRTLAYDCVLKRPACILVQALMGCSITAEELGRNFEPLTWLVNQTPDMRVYETSDEQLARVAEITRRAHG